MEHTRPAASATASPIRRDRSIFLAAAVALVGCNAVWGIDELSFGSGTGGMANASSNGSGGGSSTGGTAGAATGGSSAGGSGGNAPSVLVDTGLVARYFIDEAASAQGPTEVLDAAPQPVALPIVYTAELSFSEVAGNRGLAFSMASAARVSRSIDGTKLYALLHGKTTATIETVLDYPMPQASTARIVQFGPTAAGGGRLALRFEQQGGRVTLNLNDTSATITDSAIFEPDLAGAGRIVIHAVLDTTQQLPADRIRLYVDAMPAPPAANPPNPLDPPTLGETIDLGTGSFVTLGNRELADRPFVGVLYYVAVYAVPLTPAEIANNAAVLRADDDAP